MPELVRRGIQNIQNLNLPRRGARSAPPRHPRIHATTSAHPKTGDTITVARVEDRWLSKKKDSEGKRKRKSTYGVGNRWMAIWDDLDGIARTKKFPTQEQAQAFLDDVTADKNTGNYLDAREKFIGDLMGQ